MTATLLFGNNVSSTLAGGINSVAVSCTVAAGTGANFPAPAANQLFKMTLVDVATGLINEIVHVTAVAGDVFTIVRGQEGTTAKNWLAGDLVNMFMTAGTAQTFTQPAVLQNQPGNYATDTGTANALVITLSEVPPSLAALTGTALRIKKSAAANNAAVTVNVNALGAVALTHGDGSAIGSGELPANGYITVVGTGTGFQLQSVSTAVATGTTIQQQAGNYAVDTGTANALVITLAPVPASWAFLVGVPLRTTKSNNVNTGAVTINPNALGAKSLIYGDGSAMSAGDLPANCTLSAIYDGTNVILQSIEKPPVNLATQPGVPQQGVVFTLNGGAWGLVNSFPAGAAGPTGVRNSQGNVTITLGTTALNLGGCITTAARNTGSGDTEICGPPDSAVAFAAGGAYNFIIRDASSKTAEDSKLVTILFY